MVCDVSWVLDVVDELGAGGGLASIWVHYPMIDYWRIAVKPRRQATRWQCCTQSRLRLSGQLLDHSTPSHHAMR